MASGESKVPTPIISPISASVATTPTLPDWIPREQAPPATRIPADAIPPTPPRGAVALAGEGSLIPEAYGRVMINRQRIFAFGYLDPLYYFASLWCAGECEQVESIWNGDLFYADGSNARATNYTGTPTQTYDTELAAAISGYTDDMAGMCYSVIKFHWNNPLKISQIRAIVQGKKIYDPRSGLTAFSDNFALFFRDLATSQGLSVDDDNIIVAANYNDEDLGGGHKRRWGGLLFDKQETVDKQLELIAEHAGCYYIREAGVAKLVPDAPSSTVYSFSDAPGTANIVKDSLKLTKRSLDNLPNHSIVEYLSDDTWPWATGFAETPLPGGEIRSTNYRMRGFQSYAVAYRHAIERQNRFNLTDLSIEFETFDEGLAIEVGDVFDVTHNVGLVAKKFRAVRVTASKFVGSWVIQGEEYDPLVYSDTIQTEPTWPDVSLPWPYPVPTPSDPDITFEYRTNAEDAVEMWAFVDWDDLTSYVFDHYFDAQLWLVDPDIELIAQGQVSPSEILIGPVEPSTDYKVHLAAINYMGVSSTVRVKYFTTPDDVYSFVASDVYPESVSDPASAQMDFYPSTGNTGFDFAYTSGREPAGFWLFYHQFTDTELTGNNQIWIKATVNTVVSGESTLVFTENGGDLDTWLDLWDDWVIELQDDTPNGVPEHQEVTISLAKDDGFGAPDLATVESYPVTFYAYRGASDYIIQDVFTGSDFIDLESHSPTIDRRDDGAGDGTSEWRDLYYEEEDYNHAYFRTVSNDAKSGAGTTDDLALYVIDAKATDVQLSATVQWDATAGGSAGIAGRVQDTGNFWLLAVKNPSVADPVLGLYKVASGTHTLEASVTLTGLGPIDGAGDAYPLKLTFEGDDITGEIGFSDPSVLGVVYSRPVVTLTDSAYNTETDFGIWTDGQDTIFQELSIAAYPTTYSAIVWDTAPFTTSVSDTGSVSNNVYFYEGSNGKVADPYHSSAGYYIDKDTLGYKDVIDWRGTPFDVNTYVIKIAAVSGDTADVEIREFGTTLKSFDEWIDLYRCDVRLDTAVSESKSAVVNVTVAIDDGTKNPLAGTEVTKQITFNSTSTGP